MSPLVMQFIFDPTLTQIQPLDSAIHVTSSDANDVNAGGDTGSTYDSNVNLTEWRLVNQTK